MDGSSYDDEAARRAVVETGRRMNAAGINQGTSGNISLRNPHGFLVTPTSLPYDAMEPGDIVQMGFDGSHEGRRRPSSEWRFHRDILAGRSDVEVVLHCHSIFATTLACLDRPIPAFHYMVGVAGGTTIRCARYATFGTQALSDAAIEALQDRLACLPATTARSASGAPSTARWPWPSRSKRWRASTSRCCPSGSLPFCPTTRWPACSDRCAT